MGPKQRAMLGTLFAVGALNAFLPWTNFGFFSLSLWDYARYATAFQVEVYGGINLLSPFGMLYLFYSAPFAALGGTVGVALLPRYRRTLIALAVLQLVYTLGFIGAYLGVSKLVFFVNTIDVGMVAGVAVSVAVVLVGALGVRGSVLRGSSITWDSSAVPGDTDAE